MTIRILIVDDEPLARERIRSLLKSETGVEIVGEAASGVEALACIRKHSPDLVFLDVQMPGMGGFEMLAALGEEQLPLVIFVTAYDQHALKAFEVHALDYLLKPFKPARFKQTLERARQELATKEAGTISENLLDLLRQHKPKPERLTRLAVRIGERVVFVKIHEVSHIEAAGNYLVLHVGKESHIIRDTLGALQEKLDPRQFLRISRSTLVNVDQIKEMRPFFKGEHVVILLNGKELAMTRGFKEVREALGLD
ncbi:MAG: DNA-binding response regulator [Verrucomicrobia bacterium]|nr:MAG: DNA-binding response regulator [Verrucomicrobiota bacterium]